MTLKTLKRTERYDFRVVLFIGSPLRIRNKYFSLHGEYAEAYKRTVLGECAKNILSYVDNTPMDINLRLSRRIFDQNQRKKTDP